ncbi:MAG: MaoC family dehydratase, partial [Nitrosopumilaceae archaeon]|nr:MaoC family dehydratase [Nitrosopumilaceae archaeon]
MTKPANEYTYEQIKIGDIVTFTEKIDKTRLDNFANLSGDHNPLHMSNSYATNTKFAKQICHGMLLASFFSKLVGMYMPGKNALYFSQTLNFQAPCYVNDEILIQGEVIDKSDATRMITLKTLIHNNRGTCLVDGIAKWVHLFVYHFLSVRSIARSSICK